MRIFFKKPLLRITSIILSLMLLFTGCSNPNRGYKRYTYSFFDTFDTVVLVMGYAKNEREFTSWCDKIHSRFVELNNLYHRFWEFSGINNIATVNKNAGLAPVKVDPLILDMVEFGIEWYEKTDGQINITMGPVLQIWHEYISIYSANSEGASLPSKESLEKAAENTDISDIVIDREASTLYLAKPGMALDVGAVAKGYAAQLVADEIYEAGFHSFAISAGGNIVCADAPLNNELNAWSVGIQNPFEDPTDPNSDILGSALITNASMVTSGDYQRYYMVGEQRVHHIIDPDTLLPSYYYHSVTVVHEDSGIADCLSTALFCMVPDISKSFAEENDLKVMWVLDDGSVEISSAMLPLLTVSDSSAK